MLKSVTLSKVRQENFDQVSVFARVGVLGGRAVRQINTIKQKIGRVTDRQERRVSPPPPQSRDVICLDFIETYLAHLCRNVLTETSPHILIGAVWGLSALQARGYQEY